MKKEIDKISFPTMIISKLIHNPENVSKEDVINFHDDDSNEGALHKLAKCRYDDPDIIPKYLLEDKSRFYLNEQKKNALMLAIEANNFRIAKLLKKLRVCSS